MASVFIETFDLSFNILISFQFVFLIRAFVYILCFYVIFFFTPRLSLNPRLLLGVQTEERSFHVEQTPMDVPPQLFCSRSFQTFIFS